MSKPLHQPTEKTRAEIVALRSYGVPIKEVAAYIGIDDKTLYKYYKDELESKLPLLEGYQNLIESFINTAIQEVTAFMNRPEFTEFNIKFRTPFNIKRRCKWG